MKEFATRRAQLIKQIGPSGIAIIKAAPISFRNHYHEYPYRQNSDFYYLTGFNEPEAILILAPNFADGEFILFCQPNDPEKEVWNGYRAGQAGAKNIYGADVAWDIGLFKEKFSQLLENRNKIYYPVGMDLKFDKNIFRAVNNLRGKIRNGAFWPNEFVDIQPLIHEMRVIKSPDEINLMRKAGEISTLGHIRAMQACKPGMYEYQIEAELIYTFLKHGSQSHAYTPIVGSGENTCILHYVNNNKKIADGDLVLIDAGCEYQCYASDITRTFPANGKFSAEQRAVYEVVLAAQLAGINALRPGNNWDDIENNITRTLVEGLTEIGLLKGNVDSLIETKAYLPFYMHRCGHFLGLDTHDAGRYKVDAGWRILQPGMVRTMEPGLYISAKIPNIPERWHNIGIRIEDDVLITATGNEVLNAKLPKKIDDIENIMAGINDFAL